MQGTISVEDALKKGDRMIKYPSMLIFMGLFIVIPILMVLESFEIYWGMLAGFIAGAFFGLLYSCYMTTKWRIWAFGNVTDVHELKKAAITEKYIPKDGSWQEKLEIRTTSDKEALLQIQERFNEKYIFSDDLTIPYEMQIFNSRNLMKLLIFISFFLIALVIYLSITLENWLLCFIIFVPAGVSVWQYKKLSNRNPQIVLNSEGIQTSSSGFASWKEITDEEVIKDGVGKESKYYLNYQFQGGNEHFCLEYLDITPRALNHLLAIYRSRFIHK